MTREQPTESKRNSTAFAEGLENRAGKKKKDDFDNVTDEDSEKEKQNSSRNVRQKTKKKTNNEPKETVQTDSQTSPAGHPLRRSQLLIAL